VGGGGVREEEWDTCFVKFVDFKFIVIELGPETWIEEGLKWDERNRI
jgi:hypothetical protein